MKATRRKLYEIVDRMLAEDIGVARIAKIVGVSQRTIYTRKAARKAARLEETEKAATAEIEALGLPYLDIEAELRALGLPTAEEQAADLDALIKALDM